MIFALTRTQSGFWGWMLMLGTECIAKSTQSFPTELTCRMEIERLRREVSPDLVNAPVVHDWARGEVASF